MCQGQTTELQAKLSKEEDSNTTCCILGTGISPKTAQQFRDQQDGSGIDIYSEFTRDGTPSGRSCRKLMHRQEHSKVHQYKYRIADKILLQFSMAVYSLCLQTLHSRLHYRVLQD